MAGVLGLEPEPGDSHTEDGPSPWETAPQTALQKSHLVQGQKRPKAPSGRGWPPWAKPWSQEEVVCLVTALRARAHPLRGDLGWTV